MDAQFTRAIVRPPSPNFADGLTTVDLGAPDVPLALAQHEAYCRALEACGLSLIRLAADPRFPDSTFVEDAAILTPQGAVITRPGAPSRAGEAAAIRDTLAPLFPRIDEILVPGTIDGGDICEAGRQVFLGVSRRTNTEGTAQLAAILALRGYTTVEVDVRATPGILHLKSGIAWLGGRRLAVIPALAEHPAFRGWELLVIPEGEEYAANAVLMNGRLLVASGFPRTEALLRAAGHDLLPLDMSEFRKMDGGLSCLSLRF
jgi:dimethylargininase